MEPQLAGPMARCMLDAGLEGSTVPTCANRIVLSAWVVAALAVGCTSSAAPSPTSDSGSSGDGGGSGGGGSGGHSGGSNAGEDGGRNENGGRNEEDDDAGGSPVSQCLPAALTTTAVCKPNIDVRPPIEECFDCSDPPPLGEMYGLSLGVPELTASGDRRLVALPQNGIVSLEDASAPVALGWPFGEHKWSTAKSPVN